MCDQEQPAVPERYAAKARPGLETMAFGVYDRVERGWLLEFPNTSDGAEATAYAALRNSGDIAKRQADADDLELLMAFFMQRHAGDWAAISTNGGYRLMEVQANAVPVPAFGGRVLPQEQVERLIARREELLRQVVGS